MATIPERFKWATEMLSIQPDFNILEIGCGVGILADCMAEKLNGGSILAIDKSASMLEKAVKRNQSHIDKKKVNFMQKDFSKSKLPENHFDRIVAFNVNFFWKNPKNELELIKHALKRSGLIYIFYQFPFEIDIKASLQIKEKLIENKFKVIHTKLKKLQPTSALCIIAKPGVWHE